MGAGSLWEQYAWQIQTYAELRRKQSDALPVVAGVLLYVNELSPTSGDLSELKKEAKAGMTDVTPANGSLEATLLSGWTPGKPIPDLPFEFRLRRAFRIVQVNKASVETALLNFDEVVKRIETCRGREVFGDGVLKSWERNPAEEQTCVVCDSRTFCPDYQTKYASRHGSQPKIPAIRIKPVSP